MFGDKTWEDLRELDAWVYEYVFGNEGFHDEYHDLKTSPSRNIIMSGVPRFTTEDFWQVVEKLTAMMGYGNPGFVFHGPLFKPNHQKLATVSLDKTCWYVRVKLHGQTRIVTGGTPGLAVCEGAYACRRLLCTGAQIEAVNALANVRQMQDSKEKSEKKTVKKKSAPVPEEPSEEQLSLLLPPVIATIEPEKEPSQKMFVPPGSRK